MKNRRLYLIIVCLLIAGLVGGILSGCAETASAYCNLFNMGTILIPEEAVALAAAPAAVPSFLKPEASGKAVKEKNGAVVDYSNAADGYVMCQFKGNTDKGLKVQVEGPTTKYSYNLNPGEWATFPLSDGNGSYKVGIYQNVSGSKYSKVTGASFNVTLKDEFGPFLYSNPYVNFENAKETIAQAEKLVEGKTKALEKVAAVYDFVIKNFTYDDELAENVSNSYLPDLDKVLASKKGICFDYAAMMAGMLRSQKLPVKLVIGYAGDVYHAWISVYSEDEGWIDGAVYFDGKTWMRMDPTFASTGGNTAEIKKYIGDGSNYAAKYFY